MAAARSTRRSTRRTRRRTSSPQQQLTTAFNRLVAERPMVAGLVLLAVVVVGLLWLWLSGSSADSSQPAAASLASSANVNATAGSTASTSPATTTSPKTTTPGGTSPKTQTSGIDPLSGLPLVALDELPQQASDTVELIRSDGPFPYGKDGAVFGNFEGLLPDRSSGYYREYTVITPGENDRGARRIVAGADGEMYYTDDHYESFVRIAEDQ